MAENDQLIGKMTVSRAALAQLGTAGKTAGQEATQGLGKVTAEAEKIAPAATAAKRGLDSISKSLGDMRASVAALAGIGIGLAKVREYTALAAQMSDAYSNITSKIRNVTDSEQELVAVRQQLFAVSQATRSSFETTSELYTRLARATADLNVGQQQLIQITETINQAFVVSGATTQEANAAIIQLSQGLAAGALRGDEFNSVAEQAPAIMDMLSQSLGKTRGELRQMAEQGQLTADVIVTALGEGAAGVAAQFDNMQTTISGALQQLQNAALAWIGSANEATGVSKITAGAISLVASNFGLIATAVAPVALAITAVLVPALLGAAAGTSAVTAAVTFLNTALLRNPFGIAAVAVGTLVGALLTLRNAEAQRQAEFEAGIRSLDETSGALERMSVAFEDAATLPPKLSAQFREAASAAQQLADAQDALAEKRMRIAQIEAQIEALMRSRTAGGAMLAPLGAELAATRAEYDAMEQSIGRLSSAVDLAASDFASRLAPAIEAGTDALVRLATATDAVSAFQAIRDGIAGVVAEVQTLTSAEDRMRSLFGVIQAGAAKSAEDLKTAGKSAVQIAQESVAQFEAMAAQFPTLFGPAVLGAMREQGKQWITNAQAIEKAKTAASDAAKAQREQDKAQREAAQAAQMLQRANGDLARSMIDVAVGNGDMTDALGEYAKGVMDAIDYAEDLRKAKVGERAVTEFLEDALRSLQGAYERNTRAAEADAAASAARANVVGNLLADLETEARLSAMTTEQRRVEEIVLRAVAQAQEEANRQQDASIALGPAQVASLRQQVAAQLELIDTNQRARRSIEDNQRAWEDFSYGLADALLAGGRQTSDYLKRLLDDLKRQILGSGIHALFRSIFGIGGTANGGPQSMLGAMFGGGGGGSGLFGNLLGGGGNNAGALGSMLFGGGSGFTGLMNLFRGGTISSSMGIQQVNAITGAQGASGGAGSIFGGGMLQNGFSMGGMMGAGGGIMMGLQGIRTGNALQGAAGGAMAGMSIGGPWGALIGGIIGGLGALIRGNKPPDFRVGGTQASVRNPEGGFETVFGRVRAGSREISWESLVQPMQQFDQAIADMVQSFGAGQQQMDSIRDALARWSVDLKGDAATAEGVLGSRFGAILSTFSQDVQTFVGNTGTVQERVGRLADALAIEDIVDVGALGDSFADVSALLGEYRQGTEAITDTYARVLGSVTLLDQALALSGTTLDMTRGELIRFAADITDAAGGLERAQQLWGGYYATFYTETERAQVQLAQATERATALFAAANLDLAQYTGDGGAAAFRDMFERLLPTLSAEAVVQYLEMAEALGIVIDLTGQASGNVSEFAGTLADLMADVTGQLAEFAPQQSWAQQLAAITTETEALITRATELGATEEQLATIRELGAARVADVLAQQADAYRQYADLVGGLADEAADLRGLTDYQREMREIDRWTRQTADALNTAARAAGMQSAAEEDLALMHEVAAGRAAAAMARLREHGRDLVEQLRALRTSEAGDVIEAGGAVGTWMGQVSSGMDQVTQATDNAVQALIGAQQRVRDWLNGIMSSDLSGLRPRDRLTEMLALAERTRAAAAGGDAEALARMPQIADELLRLGRDVYASGSQYFGLRDMVRGWMQELADIVIPEPAPSPGPAGGGGGGGGGGGAYGDAYTLEQEAAAAERAAAERRALALELTAVIRDMMSGTQRPLSEIEETLGYSMAELVADLGVSLSDLSVATASQLATIAQSMGVELTDLAAHVGVSLGSLGDRQSLLNDALESTIATLPAGQRDLLEPLLRDVEEAAALGDVAGVEEGISDMEDAIADMAPELRDLLAPYFARITPADPATELSHLATMETTLGSSLSELQAQTLHLAAIEGLLNGGGLPLQPTGPLTPGGGFGGGGVPPPGYAVGTSYVPADGLAYLHRGEMVWPAAVSDFFRREGIPISAPPRAFAAMSNDAGDPAVTGLLRDLVATARESQAELRALRERVAQLESTIAQGDDKKVRAMDRQTDRLNRT